jgi:hypothetical protein
MREHILFFRDALLRSLESEEASSPSEEANLAATGSVNAG